MNDNAPQSWYIAKVVTIEDPDKRRRIQARGPHESEDAIETDKLPWLQPLQLHPDDFSLPEVDEPILVLCFGEFRCWIELPNKEAWQDFGNDYVNALLFTHKDVLYKKYTESNGFEYKYKGKIYIETDDTKTTIDGKDVTLEDGQVTVKIESGNKVSIKVGSTIEIKASTSEIEMSTAAAGFKMNNSGAIGMQNSVGGEVSINSAGMISIKNSLGNLNSILNDIYSKLATHTHICAVGPVSPNPADPVVVQLAPNLIKVNGLLQ